MAAPAGANEARQHRAQQEHAGVSRGRPMETARHDDAAGHDIEREKERDEAHVVGSIACSRASNAVGRPKAAPIPVRVSADQPAAIFP